MKSPRGSALAAFFGAEEVEVGRAGAVSGALGSTGGALCGGTAFAGTLAIVVVAELAALGGGLAGAAGRTKANTRRPPRRGITTTAIAIGSQRGGGFRRGMMNVAPSLGRSCFGRSRLGSALRSPA